MTKTRLISIASQPKYFDLFCFFWGNFYFALMLSLGSRKPNIWSFLTNVKISELNLGLWQYPKGSVKTKVKTKMSFMDENPNSTPTQLKSWVSHENDFTPPPTTTGNSTSAICQLLLTQFWPDFKCRFLRSIAITWTTIITTNKNKKASWDWAGAQPGWDS